MEDNIVIKGMDASLKHYIKLNFYFDFSDNILEDENAYVTLTNEKNEKQLTIFIRDAEYIENKGYKFSMPLRPNYIMDPIIAKVFNGNNENLIFIDIDNNIFSNGISYSLFKYISWVEKYGTENKKQLCRAAKDYCIISQTYFNYNIDYNSEVSDAINMVPNDTLNQYLAIREGSIPTGVVFNGMVASFQEGIQPRIVISFKTNYAPQNFIFKIDDNIVNLSPRNGDKFYNFSLNQFTKYDQLHIPHTYSISNGNRTYNIIASAFTSMRPNLVNSQVPMERELMKSVYLYYLAALNAEED